MAKRTTIGKLVAELSVHTKPFVSGLKFAASALGSLRQAVYTTGKDIALLGGGMTAVGGAVAAQLGMAASAFVNYGDEIAKAARRTGMTTEALSELRHAGNLADVEFNELQVGFRQMSRNIIQATEGLMTYTRAFERVGLDAKELAAMTPEAAFEAIANALAKTADPMIRVATAQDIFGRSGTRLLPLLEGGAEGIRFYREEAQRLNLTLSGPAAKSAERFADMVTRIKSSFWGLVYTVGSVVAPALDRAQGIIANILSVTGRWIKAHEDLIRGLMQVAKWTVIAGAGFVAIGTAIMAVSRLLTPGGLLGVGIATLLLMSGALDGVLARWKNFASNIEIGGIRVADVFAAVGTVWDDVKIVFGQAIRFLLSSFRWLWNELAKGFDRLWIGVMQGLSRLLEDMVTTLDVPGRTIEAAFSRGLADIFAKMMVPVTGSIKNTFADLTKRGLDTFDLEKMLDATWRNLLLGGEIAIGHIAEAWDRLQGKLAGTPGFESLSNLWKDLVADWPEFPELNLAPEAAALLAGKLFRPPALEFGTVEAFSAALPGGTDRAMERNMARTAKATERSNELLQRIEHAIADADDLEVADF